MIGKMNQSVTVYTASFSSDGIGGREKTLNSIGEYWALVDFLSGDEREHAMRNADKTSVSFTMHNFRLHLLNPQSIVWELLQ